MAILGLGAGGFLLPQPVLAQVNFGGNPAAFLGIALAMGGVALYFLRNFRPQLARDYDIAFAAIALLCGAILLFQGWRLDPILTFGQYLLAGAAGFFAYESVRLRAATTEQAKRISPIVDDERPVSRVYRAELDDPPVFDEERNVSRRIRGSRDARPSDDYESSRRRPSSGRSSSARLIPGDRSSTRSSKRRSDAGRTTRSSGSDDWEAWGKDAPSDREDIYRPSSPRSDFDDEPRRPRSRRDDTGSDYVDYQPVDYTDDDPSDYR
jgi:Ycf66 protein N-terminus